RIRNLIVSDIMSAPVIAAEKTVPVSDAVDLMLGKGISALPITESGQLTGLLTLESLVRAL
ncbi:MAG: CBS domain-containing protein, partial [Methanomicrobiales archaeon]|nr:CBS domain-containing protein [Methanomicrobiales archaeon]